MVRDPVSKFESRFHYGRQVNLYDKLKRREPHRVGNLTKREWMDKNISECVFDPLDMECNHLPGSAQDLTIVSPVKLHIFTRKMTKDGEMLKLHRD